MGPRNAAWVSATQRRGQSASSTIQSSWTSWRENHCSRNVSPPTSGLSARSTRCLTENPSSQLRGLVTASDATRAPAASMTMSWLRSKAKVSNAGACLMSTSCMLVANSIAFRPPRAPAIGYAPCYPASGSEEFQRSCPLRMYRHNQLAHRTPREKPQRLPATVLPRLQDGRPRLAPVGAAEPVSLLELHPMVARTAGASTPSADALLEYSRTVLRQFRRESGHYYWQVLVADDPRRLHSWREVFGDERCDYAEAMRAHYHAG